MMVASTTATISVAAISAAAGLLGVIAGSVATTYRERRARRENAERALNVAALRCLARAKKIEAAAEGTDERPPRKTARTRSHALLGPDLDNYVAALAGVEDRATRARHWEIYGRTAPILIGQRTDNLPAVIKALEQIRDELIEAASAG